MVWLLRAQVHVPRVEAGLILLLLILVTHRGMVGITGTMVAVLHMTALFCAFIITRSTVSQINNAAASAIFSICVVLLILEALIQFFTDLHLNWFILSLLFEPGSSQNTGIPVSALIGALILIFTVCFYVSVRFASRQDMNISLSGALLTLLGAVISGQLVYSVSFYEGRAEIMQARRSLPFFTAPHPYYVRRILSFVAGPADTNPFSDTQVTRQAGSTDAATETSLTKAADKPDILMIITDSMRAHDIQKNPALAPTLLSYGGKGWLSLDHYSVSNCTHFSLYTLFTGRIATTFGETRRSGASTGLIKTLVQSGYNASTSESIALDWYDIDKIILPKAVMRWAPPGSITDPALRDLAVTENTVDQILGWNESQKPRLHVTYLNGSHFPYGADIADTNSSAIEKYHATIKDFDNNLARILSALENTGQLDTTLVIVTSDHGEELPLDGRVGHASALSDLQTKVPLLIIGGDTASRDIRSHADITPFVLSQLAPQAFAFDHSKTVYLAGCDYDHPRDFQVITDAGVYGFDYNDGYLAALDHNSPEAGNAAALLLKTIHNDGKPAQE